MQPIVCLVLPQNHDNYPILKAFELGKVMGMILAWFSIEKQVVGTRGLDKPLFRITYHTKQVLGYTAAYQGSSKQPI